MKAARIVPLAFSLGSVCFPPCLVRPGRRLPVQAFWDAKLDAMNDKMDKVLRLQESQLRLQEKQSASEKMKKRRNSCMAACEIDEHEVKQGCFLAEGGHGQVFEATYAGQPAAVKVIIVTGTLPEREEKFRKFKREIDLAAREPAAAPFEPLLESFTWFGG